MTDQDHLKKLITYHTQRLQKLKEQQAISGSTTDPKILIEIEEIEVQLAELQIEGTNPRPNESHNTLTLSVDRNRTLMDIIQLLLPEAKYPLTEEQHRILVDLLAAILKAPPGSIQILRVSPGSIWVGLAMPKADAETLIELFKANDQSLRSLLDEFEIGNISLLPIQLPPTGFEHFGPDHVSLVRLLYLGVGKVMIEQELGGGYGGAQVLLAQPINRQGRPMARQIIKIGAGPELRHERDNSTQYIEKDLPLAAARLDSYVEWRGLAGLTYVFMGDGILGQTRTLEAYYQDHQIPTAKLIQTLEDLLDKELGQRWYRHSTPHYCFFADEYGPHLAEHLRLRLRPASADGIWPIEQPPAFIQDYERLTGETIAQKHQAIATNALIQVDDLLVSKVKRNELKLQHPTNPGVVAKIEYHPGTDMTLDFSPGDRVIIRGEVVYNRQARLEEVVRTAFTGFSEAAVDVKQDRLNWAPDPGRYPNPLHFYPTVLNQILRGRKSIVHGDLHLRNILVDQTGRGWLIDFARVTERHNLYDFIKLETYIRQMVLSREEYHFGFTDYLQFEEALVAMSLGQAVTSLEHPALQKAYEVIRALRQIAAHFMAHPPDFHAEYFPALFLYNLAVLKYRENHGNKAARLAFATASVVGRTLLVPKSAAPSPAPAQADTGPEGEIRLMLEETLKPHDVEMTTGPQREKLFDTAAIRDLLIIALDANDLNDLCQDYFPAVYRDFSEGMTTRKRTRLLIDYCTHHDQFQQLVRQIRKINPERYAADFPRVVKPVLDKFASENDAEHIQAARTLGHLGEPGAIPILETQFLEESNPTVRYWLSVAIGEIGGPDAKATLKKLHTQLTKLGADPYSLLGIEDALHLAENKL